MPSFEFFFDTNEHIRNAHDLSPPTAEKYTNKSTRANLYNIHGKNVGDICLNFCGIPIIEGESRTRSGNFIINIKDPVINITLPYASFGIFPNIVQSLELKGTDFNGLPTEVIFRKEPTYISMLIKQF